MTRPMSSGLRTATRSARPLTSIEANAAAPDCNALKARITERLAQNLPQPRPFALMHVHLDDFKTIHEALQHGPGDEFQSIIEARLRRAIRVDDMVARTEVGEFVCLLVETPDRQKLSGRAAKLFETLSAPALIGELELTVRPSIGMATYPVDGTTTEKLLGVAQAAMRRARRERTGRAYVDA